MKRVNKVIIQNLVLVLVQLVLIIPYNYFYNFYASNLNTKAYIFVITYTIVCGLVISFMNYSVKIVNIGLSIFYLAFSIVNFIHSWFSYTPTIYLFVLITAYLISSTLKIRGEKRKQ